MTTGSLDKPWGKCGEGGEKPKRCGKNELKIQAAYMS
jgi:hypothetical protein